MANNTELRVGLDINNGPTVQDPCNFDFTHGDIRSWRGLCWYPATPTAQPLLAGGCIGNSARGDGLCLV